MPDWIRLALFLSPGTLISLSYDYQFYSNVYNFTGSFN